MQDPLAQERAQSQGEPSEPSVRVQMPTLHVHSSPGPGPGPPASRGVAAL